jgi:hypothetical protein
MSRMFEPQMNADDAEESQSLPISEPQPAPADQPWLGRSPEFAKAGGTGSPWSRQDSTIFRASPWAISAASTMLRPSATSPGTSGLVATYPPSSNGSTCSRIVTSFIDPNDIIPRPGIQAAWLPLEQSREPRMNADARRWGQKSPCCNPHSAIRNLQCLPMPRMFEPQMNSDGHTDHAEEMQNAQAPLPVPPV